MYCRSDQGKRFCCSEVDGTGKTAVLGKEHLSVIKLNNYSYHLLLG